ncbi:unnamed protein product [marine sediment metagenome]|uniref:Uncharacterized protein n=1 Tax=marine sediment metagenome TaxID=412755 RepID=X0RP90_9ZZZZ
MSELKKMSEYQRSQYYAKSKAKSTKVLKESDTIIKILPLLDPLLDAIEPLENSPMFRQKIKQHGKAFKIELNHALSVLNNSEDDTQKQAFAVMDQVEKVDELIKNTHVSKYGMLITILETFHDVDDADVNSFIKNIVTRQYATLKEFHIDKKIITKMKKVMPLVEDIALIQVAQQISKDQLLNTKGFGEESIKVLNEVFNSSGIKW